MAAARHTTPVDLTVGPCGRSCFRDMQLTQGVLSECSSGFVDAVKAVYKR